MDKQNGGQDSSSVRRKRLAVIVIAHVLIVTAFFVSSFIWSKFV